MTNDEIAKRKGKEVAIKENEQAACELRVKTKYEAYQLGFSNGFDVGYAGGYQEGFEDGCRES